MSEVSMVTNILLPQRLDTAAADKLKADIDEAFKSGLKINLDACQVEYVGGLCLQVLMASRSPVVSPTGKAVRAFSLFGAEVGPDGVLKTAVEEV
ncbi:hypothetical protein WSS15_31590 [Acetobacter pasteurianus]|uniref:STAS domain-containing protein n=1 Tax=Acetobacter pasteurianus NBRC 3278 TaxID=1226660 RepID=A0A401X712_ACEPA|nr:STAS domain-containing protein [Acetobacter pasteurianus]QHM90408.1 STAS domain-containing protein [Acetobacter pasteurianus]GCD63712.1 hypothetical protein NBRC3278_2805 [Acetobacter pasteurianus NBRC 3278]GCD70133.1 hypothetical protein NBRC3280_2768 [Acetobacter pasteurianus NBRC 3280]GLH30509.1 hypothetical protein WSS15_31590 [Acetobacter pasteurianus]